MSYARWSRLVDDISAAAVPVAVTSATYPGGTSYSITRRLADGTTVEIHDKWWHKNPDVWIGWQVHIDGPDSIITRTWPITKRRSDVVRDVLDALAKVSA